MMPHLRIRMKMIIAVAAMLVMGSISPFSGASPAVALEPFLGGVVGAKIYSVGGPLTVTMLESDAGMLSRLYMELYVSADGTPQLIGTNRQRGLKKRLGSYRAGAELLFYIDVYKTADNGVDLIYPKYATFYMGPGSRNSDGQAHASVQFLGGGAADIGFEDTLKGETGCDWDFNDMIFNVSGLGRHVTGGGWIHSPAGAYRCCTSLTGKVNFGFNAKYHHDAATPSGKVEFNFHSGGPNFHSASYDWLVVNWPQFWLKGSGTINRHGDYGFLLTATDSGVPSSQGTEKLRMIIWDKSTSEIIYDNGTDPVNVAALAPGNSIQVSATQAIGGGNIVIHKD